MTNNENYWFMLQFKLKLYQATGEEFQRLFNSVMTAGHGENYQSVRPWGIEGDGGNDGYLANEGRYFQVYAPSPTTKTNEAYIVKKAKDDFHKLKESQSNLKRYSFVLNDRFAGVSKPVHQALTEISNTHNIPTSVFNSGHLEQLFLELDNNQKMNIVQGVPLEVPKWIDPRMVSELLDYLTKSFNFSLNLMTDQDTAPEFEKKIQINNLHPGISKHLRLYANQVGEVNAFLNARPGMAQNIADELHEVYIDSLSAIPDTEKSATDLRFVYILERIIPPVVKIDPMQRSGWQQIALIVMAKYFETCDIYEHPDSTYST
jgi:hypothetical protein